MKRAGVAVLALCLLIAGCAISVTNSPDWCNNNPGNATCK